MAQIDSSIYQNQQAPDFLGSFQKGMQISQMFKDNKIKDEEQNKKKAIGEAYKSGFVKDADGKLVRNNDAIVGKLSELGYGQEAYGAQKDFEKEDYLAQENKFKMHNQKLNTTSQILGGVKDQNSWEQGLKQAQSMGIDTSKFSQQYDPKVVDYLNNQVLTAQERLANEWKEKGFGQTQEEFEYRKIKDQQDFKLKEQHNRNTERQLNIENLFKRETLNQKASSGENLPIDQKRVVTDLAGKNASKIAIKNQIDSVLDGVEKLDDSAKLQQYRELIKVLNSTEGSDAVGAEEVKRLASKLEFAVGGLSSGNYGQFGRDLEGFANDARIKSNAIGNAVKANKTVIDENMGRTSKQAIPKIKAGVIEGGFIFLGGDPSDQNNWKKVK